jgi:hypothetical protein
MISDLVCLLLGQFLTMFNNLFHFAASRQSAPWPALPTLSMIHRLTLLHHFLLPTTLYSPLIGGFHVVNDKIIPSQGPSETNLTYLQELEANILYASIESVRPTVTSKCTVTMIGLDMVPVESTDKSTVHGL